MTPTAPTSPCISGSSAIPSGLMEHSSLELKREDAIATMRFTVMEDLFEMIDYVTSDILIVTDISPNHFLDVQRERDKRNRKFRFRRYHSDSKILLITIPTRLHETLHHGIYSDRLLPKLGLAGSMENWQTTGSTFFRKQGHPNGDGGEGDSTGGPRLECLEGRWPTLVIEAGHSETLGELHNDMRWWFAMSNHDVKIVILAKFDHQQHHILLEKWEEEGSGVQGAITRSRATALSSQNGVPMPVLRQTITITRNVLTDPISYNITSGALVLAYRLLFLREPGPQEGDIVISVQDLQRYAQEVWAGVR